MDMIKVMRKHYKKHRPKSMNKIKGKRMSIFNETEQDVY